MQLGLWKETIADSDFVLKQWPDQPIMLFARAQAYQRLGRHEQAIADFSKVIQRYPNHAGSYQLRAASDQALGRQTEARADRAMALALNPTDPKQMNDLAWQMVNGPKDKQDPKAALELIQRALQQNPADPIFLNTLGVVQFRNGMYPEARTTLERCLTLDKDQHAAFNLYFLAMCHARLGDAAKARDCFDRAAKWHDQHRAALSAIYQKELADFLRGGRNRLGHGGKARLINNTRVAT